MTDTGTGAGKTERIPRYEKQRLLIVAVLLLGLVGPLLFMTWLNQNLTREAVVATTNSELEKLTHVLADGMRDPIWNLIPESGEALLNSIVADPRIVAVHVLSEEQGSFLKFQRDPPSAENVVQRRLPVTRDGTAIGEITVTLDVSARTTEAASDWHLLVIAASIQLVVGLGAVFLIYRISGRLERERALETANANLEAEIDERNRYAQALWVSEERLRAVTDAMPSLLAYFDKDFRYEFINRTGERWYNRTADDIIGKSIGEILDGEVEQKMRMRYDRACAGEVVTFEEKITYPDGITRNVLGSFIPDTRSTGSDGGAFVMVQDITAQKQAERVALAAKEDAEIANRAKTEFLANMSHELRTPLNSVIGYSEMIGLKMHGDVGDTRYLDYAGRINMSGNHLLSIISDLLDVSRIEIGAMELTEELVDLPDVIAASSNLIADRALRAGVTVALSPDPGLPRLRGDRLRVKQILLNLLSNAVKFTPLGGVIKVDVEIEEDGAVCLVVEDTGIGIPEHKIPEITQPFKQVESGFTRNQDGTGLGLTIAKSLIEMHDGSLHIASEIDQGTKVMVRFPAERAVHEALRSQES